MMNGTVDCHGVNTILSPHARKNREDILHQIFGTWICCSFTLTAEVVFYAQD